MKKSFLGKICLISLIFGAVEGCESDGLEFELADLENTSAPILADSSESGEKIDSESSDTDQDAEQIKIVLSEERDYASILRTALVGYYY